MSPNYTIQLQVHSYLFLLDRPFFDSCIPSIFHYSTFHSFYTNLRYG